MLVLRLRTAAVVAMFAVGLAIATMAWHGRQTVDFWHLQTPSRWTIIDISPRLFVIDTWRRTELDWPTSHVVWQYDPYRLEHHRLPWFNQLNWAGSYQQSTISGWSWHDAGWVHGLNPYPTIPSEVMVWLPTWAVVVPLTLPLVMLIGLRLWRRHRHKPGTCHVCGYDLRATPDKCPECGRATINAKG